MQEVTVHKFCDGHLMLNDEKVEEGTDTKEYDLGSGPRVIEICEWCEDNLSIKDLRAILAETGRTPEQEESNPGVKRGWGRPRTTGNGAHPRRSGDYSEMRPAGPHKCTFCDEKGYTSPQGKHLHEFRMHPWSRLKWEEDTDYLRTHTVTTEAKRARKARLEILHQMGLDLEEAVRREKFAKANGHVPGFANSLDAATEYLTFSIRKDGAA